MRVNIYCCLLVFVLVSTVTAGLIHEVVEEEEALMLSCPHKVEGKVTWSRESYRRRFDILTADGDNEIKHSNDPDIHISLPDGFLLIYNTSLSHSGQYFCDNEAAAEVTVIPSGTMRRIVSEKTTIALYCPHAAEESGVPSWSRVLSRRHQPISVHAFTVSQTLVIPDVHQNDSGLYYCDRNPAVYLNVIRDERSAQGLFYDIIVEMQQEHILNCPHNVESTVIWSKESDGRIVDVFKTSGGEGTKHDCEEWYDAWVKRSLLILKTTVSVSGRYFCNKEPAIELTVIPSGTRIRVVPEGVHVVLNCPHVAVGSDVTTWHRELRGKQKIWPDAFTVYQMLFIADIHHDDSGLYYCDGKQAVYLHVIKDERSERASAYPWQMSVRTVIGLLYLIIMISITVVTWRKARQILEEK